MHRLRTFALLCLLLTASHLSMAEPGAWVATWTASPEPADPDPNQPVLNLDDQTVRERVRISVGGARIRIRLSNEYGSSPLTVGSVTVALPKDPASVQPGSMHAVMFDGRKSITIPAGAPALSDPLDFPVPYGAEISISLYLPKRIPSPAWHALALKRAIVSSRGDHTAEPTIQNGTEDQSLLLISAVLVPAKPSQQLVVAFGDSVVDGDGSTLDADRNWPSDLIRRLGTARQRTQIAVVNQGIAGNRLLADGPIKSLGTGALARFDRDALSVPGVTHILLLEGMNDLGFPGAKLGGLALADPAATRSPEDLIAAYRQLIARAHARGVKLMASTLTPCEGFIIPGYYSESKEASRQAVNKWIRTSHEFDGIIDFDAVLRDPDHPSRLLPRFASEDHLHPNDAGYQAMADAIDITLFR